MTDAQVVRVLKLLAEHGIWTDCLFLNLSKEEDLLLGILCNDVFFWGCADVELLVSDEDIQLFAQSLEDAQDDGPHLYCARKRHMRPQGASYAFIQKEHLPLFDQAGPERVVGPGNPYGNSPEDIEAYRSARNHATVSVQKVIDE